MAYTISWEDKGVYVDFKSIVTLNDIIFANGELVGDHRFDYLLYQIFDFLDVDQTDIEKEKIKIFVSLDKAAAIWRPNQKIALVATNDLAVQLGEVYVELMGGVNLKTRLFCSKESATEWVDK